MSYTCLTCHIVFATKGRQPTISKLYKKALYAYINGIVNNLNGKLIRINGITDHVHMLVNLPATIALSDFVMKIKTASSIWLKQNPNFPMFTGWSNGYFAESLSYNDIPACRQYIINQDSHHAIYGFDTEVEKMAESNRITLYSKSE